MEMNNINYEKLGKDLCNNSLAPDFVRVSWNTFKEGVKQKTVFVSDSVTEIPNYAFKNSMCMGNIKLPENLKKIGASAFENCRQLTEINIPDTVEEIGEGAFINCSKLVTVELPKGVTEILSNTFKGCDRLRTLIIPDSVTKIEDDAFKYCKQLTDITIPDSVTEISQETLDFLQWVKAQKRGGIKMTEYDYEKIIFSLYENYEHKTQTIVGFQDYRGEDEGVYVFKFPKNHFIDSTISDFINKLNDKNIVDFSVGVRSNEMDQYYLFNSFLKSNSYCNMENIYKTCFDGKEYTVKRNMFYECDPFSDDYDMGYRNTIQCLVKVHIDGDITEQVKSAIKCAKNELNKWFVLDGEQRW